MKYFFVIITLNLTMLMWNDLQIFKMRGARGGYSRKSPRGNDWNVNLDKFVMKWWLEQFVIDLKDISAWDALRADLNSYGVNLSSINSFMKFKL